MCGLQIETLHNEISSIKGNPKDPFSVGYMCAKALALKDIHEDSKRLCQPVRRTKTGWEKISWDAAYREIKQNLNSIRKNYGNDSVALYLGNPSYHHHGSLLSGALLKKSLDSKSCYSVASSDHLPHMLAAYQLFGHMAMLPVPDIDRCQYLLCIGANPLVSNGSVMGTPFIKKRLKSLKERGGKLITIDPRKTETAQFSDQHIFIRPGQDTYLLLAMIHYIFHHRLVDEGDWQHYTHGLDELEKISRHFTTKFSALKTGIENNTIETLARDFATAEKAALYGRFGICTQKHGSLNAWLISVLNIITGNLDKEGGMMFTTPAADLALLSTLIGEGGQFDEFRSGENQIPSFDSESPAVEMADKMLSNNKEAIRAFINVAGNPVLSTPDGNKLSEALQNLDFMVAVDHYINESNQFANIILPPTSRLERSQYNMTCSLTSVRNQARYASPVFSPEKDAQHDWQILLAISSLLNQGFTRRKIVLKLIGFVFAKLGADGVLDFILRVGPYGYSFRKNAAIDLPRKPTSFVKNICSAFISIFPKNSQGRLKLLYQVSPFSRRDARKNIDNDILKQSFPLTLKALQANPNGIDLGPMKQSLPDRLFTEGKVINIAPEIYLSDLDNLDTSTDNKPPAANEFVLIGRRTPRSMNSWLNHVNRLNKGNRSNTLLMHPLDAQSLQANSGEILRLEANEASIYVKLEISSAMMRGVISLPHGRAELKTSTGGELDTSFNNLTTSDDFDCISGVSVMNTIMVSVYQTKQH